MTKKADLSLNTIVVAAIVLIVLVVLVVIFAGRMSIFRGGLNSCDGRCQTSASACNQDTEIAIYTINCLQSGETKSISGRNYCCVAKKD